MKMRMRCTVTVIVGALSLSLYHTGVVSALEADLGQCSYEADREVTIPGAGVDGLRIEAGSGSLHVEGRRGLDEIVVLGRACASAQDLLDDLDVSVERSGGDVTLITHYPDQRDREGNTTASIHLTVLVPFGLDVDVDDSSGDLVVSGTGSLTIDDSSGSIEVSDVNGPLRIEDSSGGMRVEDVRGSVTVRDGSGGIEISGVDGDVLIESDGSGSIEVEDVRGDFVVERDGSGGIRHSGVEGRVNVPQRHRGGGA